MPIEAGWNPNKHAKQIRKAKITIKRFLRKDPGMKIFFNRAHAYAVFPTVGKGGIVIGGAFGKGKVFRRGVWIGDVSLSQGSIGFQFGGQSYSEIVFFRDRATFSRFKRNNLKFAATASAVAVKSGASKKAAYERGVAVFTMTKAGLMYEAAIGGQYFKYKPKRRRR